MGVYSKQLPQLEDKIFITDAGLETELCFIKQIDLPEFAAYTLLKNQQGYEILYDYYESFARLARTYGKGLLLETVTWRASGDWGKRIGDSAEELDVFNRKAVQLLEQIREEYQTDEVPVVISGCLGPRGDGYVADKAMTTEQAKKYHIPQIRSLAAANADLITVLTMNYIEEAVGITLAAQEVGIPVVISFTVETDGKLPNGDTIEDAINAVDSASSKGPVYYMVNCAHPTHFDHLFKNDETWSKRIRGIRGNASCKSHEELDNSETLDAGNPEEFGQQCRHLNQQASQLTVLGGCCGTDIRHVEEICRNF